MRHVKTSAEDILKAEQAKDDRKRSRKNGYSMMGQRDAGYAKLRNYKGGSVTMLWHVPENIREEGVCYSGVPDGKFVLEVPDVVGKRKETLILVFDGEEFRRSLRWV